MLTLRLAVNFVVCLLACKHIQVYADKSERVLISTRLAVFSTVPAEPTLQPGHVCPVTQTLPVCCHGYRGRAGLEALLQGLLSQILKIRPVPQ